MMVSVSKEVCLRFKALKIIRFLRFTIVWNDWDVQYLSWTQLIMQSFSVRPFLYCDDTFPQLQ